MCVFVCEGPPMMYEVCMQWEGGWEGGCVGGWGRERVKKGVVEE